MPRRSLWVIVSLLLWFAVPARGAERYSFEIARKIVGVSSPRISPDGRRVVFIVSRPEFAENKSASELYAADLLKGAPRALTFERKRVAQPEWSPDGSQISFLALDAKERMQVWALPVAGGEARRLTASETSVEQYAWRPDGGAIAYTATDTVVKKTGEARHLRTMQMGEQDLFLREPIQPQHIWLQALDDSRPRRLTSGSWSVEFVMPPSSPPSPLSWSPDGKRIAFARVPSTFSGRLDSVSVAVLDVASGAITALDATKRFQNNATFSPDGRWLSFSYPREGRGDANWVNEVHVAPAGGGASRSLTRDLDRNLFSSEWLPDSRGLLVAGNDQVGTGLWVQPLQGTAKRLDLGDLVVSGAFGYDVTVSRTGAIAFTATTPSRPSELFVLDSPSAKPRRLTSFNAWADSVDWGRTERVTWRTSDGLDADGVLVVPPGFDPARRYPLVLLVHGGPTSASKANFSTFAQLMAAKGWLVFQPNYRGSDNLGNRYQSAIVGDWGEGPGRDVMEGIAKLAERPYVDTTRTAVSGWSYGGYMTTWLAGRYPSAWKVAMAGAPVTDWEEQYNYSDGNVSLRGTLGGSPWVGDNAAKYREQSPVRWAAKIKAPTLVMSNIEDFRVPPTQAMGLFRALQDNGVESEFITFPGRTHNSPDPAHQRERMRLWIEWIDRHLEKPTRLP